MAKQIDKQASLQKLVDWGNEHYGHSVNIANLNAAMEKPDWEETLQGIFKFIKREPIYIN